MMHHSQQEINNLMMHQSVRDQLSDDVPQSEIEQYDELMMYHSQQETNSLMMYHSQQ